MKKNKSCIDISYVNYVKDRLANEIQPVNHFNIYESNSYYCNVGSGHDVRFNTHIDTPTEPIGNYDDGK